jgi:hypothetical protein
MEIQICFIFIFFSFQKICWSLELILGLILTLNTQYARFGFFVGEFEMGVGNGNYNIFGVFEVSSLQFNLYH